MKQFERKKLLLLALATVKVTHVVSVFSRDLSRAMILLKAGFLLTIDHDGE